LLSLEFSDGSEGMDSTCCSKCPEKGKDTGRHGLFVELLLLKDEELRMSLWHVIRDRKLPRAGVFIPYLFGTIIFIHIIPLMKPRRLEARRSATEKTTRTFEARCCG
jgi:hypothetical protein